MKAIKFDGDFVPFLRRGYKTQTRRLIKSIPKTHQLVDWFDDKSEKDFAIVTKIKSGATFGNYIHIKPKYNLGEVVNVVGVIEDKQFPTELKIKITNVKVERIEDITEEDAIKEGFIPLPDGYEDHEGNWIDQTYSGREQFLKEMENIYNIKEGYCFVYDFEFVKE